MLFLSKTIKTRKLLKKAGRGAIVLGEKEWSSTSNTVGFCILFVTCIYSREQSKASLKQKENIALVPTKSKNLQETAEASRSVQNRPRRCLSRLKMVSRYQEKFRCDVLSTAALIVSYNPLFSAIP